MTKNAVAGKNSRLKTAGRKVWKFFSSVKLTVFVLIIIASLSIIGTVIEQGKDLEFYYMEYGERWGGLIQTLELHKMYNSPWFTALLVTLVINIIACTFDRFPPKWRSVLKEKSSLDTSLIEKLSRNETISIASDVPTIKDKLERLFKKKKYNIRVNDSSDSGLSVYAWKGTMGRFGSDITHVSLLVILLGSIIGNIWGYRDFKQIILDSTVGVENRNFQVRLDKFWIDYYPSGEIRQYNSILTVMEDGKDVLSKQIWVNEPLFYKGVRFYQSSYGTAWNRIREAQIILRKIDDGKNISTVTTDWEELKNIPNTKYSVRPISYVADFAFDEKTKTIYSKSGEHDNPALKVEVYEGNAVIGRPWLFLNYPGVVPALPGTDYELIFYDFRSIPYSGISITKDPGTNVVWLGTGIMGIGFFFAFFVYHKRLWVDVKNASESSTVKIGGLVNKNPLAFEKEFREIINSIKAIEKYPPGG